jgi:hypothetical protein
MCDCNSASIYRYRFALNTIKSFCCQLFDLLELTPEFSEVKVPETQLGAV